MMCGSAVVLQLYSRLKHSHTALDHSVHPIHLLGLWCFYIFKKSNIREIQDYKCLRALKTHKGLVYDLLWK